MKGFCTIALRSKGFTLLELMISITMIAIIAAIVFAAMRLGFRSVEGGEKKIESLERTRTSITIVESQIQSQIPLTADTDKGRTFIFTGSKEFLQFPTNYSIWGGEKGYVTVTYSVETGDNRRQSLRASETIVGLEGTRETMLFKDLDAINFEYFYKGPTDEEGKWVDEWEDVTMTPEKVRLHVVDGTRVFAMIIPMRVKGTISQAQTTAATTGSSGSALFPSPPQQSKVATPSGSSGFGAFPAQSK